MEGSRLASQSLQNDRAGLRRAPGSPRRQDRLAADTQTLNQGLIPFRIATLQIIQQLAPAGHHGKESPAGVVILFVRFEVLGELQNPLAENCYLNFWRAGI